MTTTILNSDISVLLNSLQADTQPEWGKMQPQQMTEHLLQAILLSAGKFDSPVFSPKERLPALKAYLMSDKPLQKNFVAPVHKQGQLPPLKYDSLEEANAALLKGMEYFEEYYRQNPEAIHNHPVFGPLNYDEWKQFHEKHLRHHFQQFGLIE